MLNPFPSSTSKPGTGQILVDTCPQGRSHLGRLVYQYPLKLVSPPSPAGAIRGTDPVGNGTTSDETTANSILVFLLTYGGGLVAGDAIDLDVQVGPHASLSLVTQGHTKIFRSPDPSVVTRQAMRVKIKPGAALCLLPDPVQPFAESVYEQRQIFEVSPGSGQTDDTGGSLYLLDWVTAGRTARNEVWDLWRWQGRNEVWSVIETPGEVDIDQHDARGSRSTKKRRLLLRDSLLLGGHARKDSIHTTKHLKDEMHDLTIFGTLILHGPACTRTSTFFLEEFAALPRIGAHGFRQGDAAHDQRSKTADIRAQSIHPGTSPPSSASSCKSPAATEPLLTWRTRRHATESRHGILWTATRARACTVVKFGASTVEHGRAWIGDMLRREGGVEARFGAGAGMCLG